VKQIISKCVVIAITLALGAGAFMPVPAVSARGQNVTTLVLSVPSIWQDTLTQDLLATFESQYNVNVVVTYTDTAFFGFGGPSSTITDALDSTQTNVTSADVLYVDSNSLTAADTQAGYYLDLMPLVNSDPDINTSDFIPAVWQSYQWDNGLWALPLSTDVILLTYDQTAFDNAGLAYPNERWTIDDFANAAKALTQYNADGSVEMPGFTTLSGGNNVNVFLRALAGTGFYDPTTVPNAPSFAANTTLEHVLEVAYQMIQDGTVLSQGGGFDNNVPLRVEGINGYAQRNFRNPNNQNQTQTVRYASLLPGGVAGLNTTGFAVSAGTASPELAYDLARYLTSLPDLANNQFSAVPARYSLKGTQATSNNNGNNGNGGNGGGPGGGGFFANRTIPDTIQPTVDQGLASGLPTSELRYASYVNSALSTMSTNGGDAQAALQSAEAQAVSDTQTAEARAGTVTLFVTPPPSGPTVEPGQVALNCAVNLGFGGGPGGRGQLPNQDEWNNIIADFVPNDPEIGAVILTPTNETDLATLAQTYDCFILPSNAVAGSDVSPLLNLDPLIDSDPNFDRNDVIGNTLAQLQQNNMTYALPLAIEPQMLEYDPQKFADAGVPDPTNGWTPEAFTDALKMLKPYDTDPTPFVPNDPSGSYLMMLIAAYGGLPIDYRTDPVTINFTDPTTEAAIQQVLDLAKNGYITYSSLAAAGGGFAVAGGGDNSTTPAITTNTLSRFRAFAPNAANQTTMLQTMYPQGSQYGAVAYQITTGYISATAQNPEGAYRFLSTIARNPQLFSGMPARQSLVNDPTVEAAQGQDITAIYQELDTLLRSPNTIVFPTFTEGRGGGALSFLQTYWLQKAFDNYVNNNADLDTELTDAQQITTAYLECAANIVVDTSAATGNNPGGGRFQALGQCATTADPTFSFGGGN
jgi:ABC-type glycerol-3-phosphate transport system substrate-binding protein